jgi:DUF4097 and DUF4098 domain-containing protein YvlB
MTALTSPKREATFVLSEAAGTRSRGVITISSGSGVVKAGTVLGKITATGEYAPAPAAETVGIEGAEVASAINLYTVDATSADVKVAAIVRDAEVNVNELTYAASVDQAGEKTAKHVNLAAVGIIVR